MRIPLRRPAIADRTSSRGQSMVEFALFVPVLLLLLLIAVDFGRIYLGWVNVQQMARLAANYAAENASAWSTPGDPRQARYEQLVRNDARLINCTLPPSLPPPQITGGLSLGSPVTVNIDCAFGVLTPIISQIVGSPVLASASATFPIKEGVVGAVPGGGAPIVTAPIAEIIASPRSGWGPLTVTFTDGSRNAPGAWTWDFEVGTGGTGSPTPPSPATANTKGPHDVTFGCSGTYPDFCTYSVDLAVSNGGGSDLVTMTHYVTVYVPPDNGPIAEFTGSPRTGVEPVTVTFQFTPVAGDTTVYTSWQWDFTNDGTFDANGATATHTYTTEGQYAVRLRVGDGTAENELTKAAYVIVSKRICTVPDFANTRRNDAQARWSNAGFSTNVQFAAGNGNYTIRSQSIIGGTADPQPDGCDSNITVGP